MLNERIKHTIKVCLVTISLPLVLGGVCNYNSIHQKPKNVIENLQTKEYNKPIKEELEKAYNFIINKIEIKTMDYVNLTVQKGQDAIIIIYSYNEEKTNELRQVGVPKEEFIPVAEDNAIIALSVKEILKDKLNLDIDIEVKVIDYKGNVFTHVRNNDLLELNSLERSNPELNLKEV